MLEVHAAQADVVGDQKKSKNEAGQINTNSKKCVPNQ
jgi:hypothetical protein